jgi:hypothetical protein
MKLILTLIVAATLAGCSANCIKDGDSITNVMVMAEDSGGDTISRSSPISDRVVGEVQSQLSASGYEVYDETAASSGNFSKSRARKTRADLLDIARTISPQMDVVALITSHANVSTKSYTTNAKVSLEGELVEVQSGKHIGQFDVSGDQISLSEDCSRQCITDELSDQADILAADLGSVMAEQLDSHYIDSDSDNGECDDESEVSHSSYSQTFQISLEGFSPKEANHIEDALEGSAGYEDHRLNFQNSRKKDISYSSTLAVSKLNRVLYDITEDLGLRSRIQISGNDILVQKTIGSQRIRIKDDGYEW